MADMLDLPALAREIARGERSIEDLTRSCLERIARDDGEYRSVIALDEHALDAARALDAERSKSGVRGRLFGIPLLIKDNIETAGALPTTAGSLALAANVTGRDAPVGAVILGKTNLSEWANFRSRHSSSGWSAVGGQTRNAHDLARSPCGSSSGSAVAVAAGFAPGAIGTETNGSIVCPASVNGVVAIKPTVGLVSRSRIVPISVTQDTAGPMASTVAGAATLLSAMTAYDDEDPAMRAARPHLGRDYAQALGATSLHGRRIGAVMGSGRFHPEVEPLFRDALARLRTAGAEIVPDLRFSPPDAFRDAMLDVMLYEFRDGIDRYLASSPAPVPADLAALIAFNREHATEEMSFFGQDLFELAQAKGGLQEERYLRARELVRRVTREEGIDGLMTAERLDAIVGVTSGPAWTIDSVNGDRAVGGSSTYGAVAGYPHVTLPMGSIQGLPVGLSVMGRAFSEPQLLEIAAVFERVRGPR